MSARFKDRVKCVVVAGLAGSGKTTIGNILSRELGATYIDKDTLYEDFVEELLRLKGSYKGDRESEVYVQEINPIEYRSLNKVVIESLGLGDDVVVSAPFLYQIENLDWFEKNVAGMFEDGYVDLKIIWIKTDRETDYLRLTSRGAAKDQYKLLNWMEYSENVKRYEEIMDNRDKKKSGMFIFDNRSSNMSTLESRTEPMIKWIKGKEVN